MSAAAGLPHLPEDPGTEPRQPALFEARPAAEDGSYRGPQACSAAGITYRQLDYWARTGLVTPSVCAASGSGTQRLYSFRDVLVLRVVKRLLDAGGVPAQRPRRDRLSAAPWRRRPLVADAAQ